MMFHLDCKWITCILRARLTKFSLEPSLDRKTNITLRSENRARRRLGAFIHTPADVTIICDAGTHRTLQKTTS
ncbi:unnamed protein product [Leptosia nina]|uniref:Uncharacterized protein n=1 Tax=Leptosia nina TaxID=320188 RepID=A0AAV1JFR1_9NEOP